MKTEKLELGDAKLMTIKHSFYPKDTPRRRLALYMAKKRGEAYENWVIKNKLTKSNQHELRALMKKTDKKSKLEFEEQL